MDVLSRLANAGVVPVVVLDDAKNAVPTANAMVAGGIDVMEITFRTAAAPDAIKAVAENCPDMLVGAGTILNLEQCKLAVSMGAKTFVHISFERHLGYATISARQALFKENCARLGLEYVEATAPDPTGDAGVTGAQAWVTENIKVYVDQYGKDTAFFCTNCSMQVPLIQQCAELGAIYPQQCCPSPYHGYPSAFNISTEGHEGDVPYMLDQITQKVAEYGNTGRMSTWEVPVNMVMIEAGFNYAEKWIKGEIKDRCDEAALLKEIQAIAGDAASISKYSDEASGEIANFFMILCPFYDF